MGRIAPGSTGAVRRRYDRLAAVYDRRWASYVEDSVRETLRRVEVRDGERVLDVGCGTGALLEAIAGRAPQARLAGVDLSPAMLAVARRRRAGRAALVVGDATHLPLAGGRFDLVLSTSALRYWPDPAAALAEIARILAPGGRLAITDWCDDYLACRITDLILRVVEPGHRRAYGTEGCGRLLREAGFGDVRVERYRIGGPWGLMTGTATSSR